MRLSVRGHALGWADGGPVQSGRKEAGRRHGAAEAIGVAALIAFAAAASHASAQSLTIRDIQYTTDPNGASDYNNQVVDCLGGIVVGKFPGYRPRLVLQDPNSPDGWGGIQVKDWIYPFQMFEDAQIGDWVELTNMLVEEFRGTTFLQRQSAYNPGHNIVSQGNELPPPLLVSVSDIPAPIEGPPGEWYVENHAAEYLESMRIFVLDVEVTVMDLGKAVDNYNLQNPGGESCWAADYMNADRLPFPPYHPFVAIGQDFSALGGILEQYTRVEDGWDYYQLLTQCSSDLAIYGDMDCDGVADFGDINPFVQALLDPARYAAEHPLCNILSGDGNADGVVDFGDINPFVERMLGG